MQHEYFHIGVCKGICVQSYASNGQAWKLWENTSISVKNFGVFNPFESNKYLVGTNIPW